MNQAKALKLLRGGREGIKKWNLLRAFGEVVPNLDGVKLLDLDLYGVDLQGASLVKANFAGSDLFGARFAQANLTLANFYRADLVQADFTGVNLKWAILKRTDLYQANLFKANLSHVDFERANLVATNVVGADFQQCKLCNTVLTNLDLSKTTGLKSVIHDGPSQIGVNTLIRSRGNIPDVFLRGCGVPEVWIEYLPSLIGAMQPIQFYSCFISHTSNDADFVRRLKDRMERSGLRVWYAPEDLKGGRKLHEQIDAAIRSHEKLLLVLSEASMASDWVTTEIRKARQAEKREHRRMLFPIRLVDYETITRWECFDEGEDLAVEVRSYYIPDFSNWQDNSSFESAFQRLLDDLKKSAESPLG